VFGIVAVVGAVAGVMVAIALMRPRLNQVEAKLRDQEAELATAQAARVEAVTRAERIPGLEDTIRTHEHQREGLQLEVRKLSEDCSRLEMSTKAAETRLEEGLRDREASAQRDRDQQTRHHEAELQEKVEATNRLIQQSREAQEAAIATAQTQFDERRLELQGVVDKLSQELDAMRKQMTETFTAVSAEVLQKNNEAFLTTANEVLAKHQKEAEGNLKERQEAIDGLVKPLSDKLRDYDSFLKEFQTKTAEQTTKATTEIKALLDEVGKQRESTQDLREMLRGPSARGRLGELYLKRMLDEAGLLEGIHYSLQTSEEVDGVRARPDAIVKLPSGKTIVIDAKTPLSYYEQAISLDDESARAVKLREHAAAVRKHVDDLIKRPYHDLSAPVEIVVMYLPLEASLSAALQVDPEIHTFGWDKGVAVCSPTLLFFLLRIAARDWRQADVERNAEEIAKLGKDMVNRIRVVADKLAGLGKSLNGAVTAYNDAQSSLERNLLTQAQKFQRLGVGRETTLKALPDLNTTTREFSKPELRSLPDADTQLRLNGEDGDFEETDSPNVDDAPLLNPEDA